MRWRHEWLALRPRSCRSGAVTKGTQAETFLARIQSWVHSAQSEPSTFDWVQTQADRFRIQSRGILGGLHPSPPGRHQNLSRLHSRVKYGTAVTLGTHKRSSESKR